MKNQQRKKEEVKKTTFTLDEYDKAVVDLEFIQAALDVTINCDEPDDAVPILCEAVIKTANLFQLIRSMHPAKVTT